MYRKYHNAKLNTADGRFDSKKEYNRWLFLKDLEQKHQIANLQRQVKFQLLPSQRVDGRVVERPATYIADFVYEINGQIVVEDTKGVKTPDYILKRKMMLFILGIQISEV